MIHKSTVLLLIAGVCLGGDVVLSPGPVNGAVGGSVWINTTISRTNDEHLRSVEWRVMSKVVIISTDSSITSVHHDYKGRVNVDTHTGSLQLLNLTERDSGTYTVTIIKIDPDSPLRGTTTLEVSELCLGSKPVPGSVGKHVWINTTVSPATKPLSLIKWTVKEQHIVTFNSSQTVLDPVYRDRVRLDNHTGSLELLNVTVSDSGEYTVTIQNTTEDSERKCRTVLSVYDNFHRRDRRGAIASFGFFTVVIGGLGIYLWYRNGELDQIEPNEQEMTPYSHVNANDPDVSNDH